jgi:hypothetical protein
MDEFDIFLSEIPGDAKQAKKLLDDLRLEDELDRSWRSRLEDDAIREAGGPVLPDLKLRLRSDEEKNEPLEKRAKTQITARSVTSPNGSICDYDAEDNLIRCRVAGVPLESFDHLCRCE